MPKHNQLKDSNKKNKDHREVPDSSERLHTTSGSELEIEQRVLLKGNIVAARSSLLDFIQLNSWIKKSNYEGIFNALLLVFFLLLFHKPMINWVRMGRPVDPYLINQIIWYFEKIIIANIFFFLFAFSALGIQKLILMGVPEKLLIMVQYVLEFVLFAVVIIVIKIHPEWPITHHFFLAIQTQVIFCKMHSYLLTNSELREKHLWQQKIARQAKIQEKSNDSQAYPNNVNFFDFLLYLMTPTLVYEVNFPRRSKFRPFYFLCHSFMVLANIFVQYMVATEDIIPIIKGNLNAPIIELYLKLQMDLILIIMLLIFLLFESFPNATSELTLYADREFYQDWWNAASIEEFYGKWLRFSYLFYYRHVYMKLMIKYKVNPPLAKAITNLISSVMQEIIMIMALQTYGLHILKAQLVATLWSFIQHRYQPFDKELMNTIVLLGFLVAAPLLMTFYISDFNNKV